MANNRIVRVGNDNGMQWRSPVTIGMQSRITLDTSRSTMRCIFDIDYVLTMLRFTMFIAQPQQREGIRQ
eukprot:3143025-Amphidinium_carterae.1